MQVWGRWPTSRSPRVPRRFGHAGVGMLAHNPVHPECPDASVMQVWGRWPTTRSPRVPRRFGHAGVWTLAHDPFTPSAPTLRRGVSRGPHSSGFGAGLRAPLDSEQLPAVRPLDVTAQTCYYAPVTATPHVPLSTMEHPCPILFRPVPPQIRNVEHLVFHFSAKCSIAQIGMEHFGTQWNSSHENRLPQLSTNNYPLVPPGRQTRPRAAGSPSRSRADGRSPRS